MLYGGPLGTYLSGYYGPGSSKSGSPSFTSTGSGPSSTSSYSRPRTGRYRTPSAYGVPSSGTSTTTSLTPNSSRSSFYTPQTRRKYSDESTESPVVNRSRYTTSSGTPVNLSNSSTNSSTTGSSGYYSRPSPSYTSSSSASTVLSSSTVPPSAITGALVSPPPSSYARAATLSPYDSVPRQSQPQNRSRRLQEPLYFPYHRAMEPNLDYKRLYEAERADNKELKNQIEKAQAELLELRTKVDEARRLPAQHQQSSQRINYNESDQRMLEELRAASEKLKAEHRALTGVITRLM